VQSEIATLAGGRNMIRLAFDWFDELKATLNAGR
jgi:hypothetical protein